MMGWSSSKSFRIHWIKYPFIRILIPFVIGILATDVIQVPFILLIIFITVCLFLLWPLHIISKQNWAIRNVFGGVSFLIYTLFGVLWTGIRDERLFPRHYVVHPTVELVTKTYYLEEKDRYWDCYSRVIFQLDSNGNHSCSGNVLLRIPKAMHIKPGMRDLYQGIYMLRSANHASAPFEFDWNKLLHYRNIHHLAYVDTTKFIMHSHASPTRMERSREYIDLLVDKIFNSDRDYPVASAMLLGLRKKMDPELYRAYSATGAVHVLAVSGLHVGIIAHIFTILFSLLRLKNKHARIIQLSSILLIIWGYTFITGASPSIVRSSVMFSLFALSKPLQRDTAPLNILAGTAFVLLLIQPLDIYNIGFQLSFGAMTGIFMLYEPIRKLINPTHKAAQVLWSIIALSLSAQLMIYPIVGYHFHQFAFYFWLTSLISTPFSYLILLGGMVALPVEASGVHLLYFLQYPLIYGIQWMNDIIAWIYTLPLGKVAGWWPTPSECLILTAFTCALAFSIIHKTLKSFKAPIVSLIIFFTIMLWGDSKDQSRSELIVSLFRGSPKAFVKEGSNLIMISSDSTFLASNYVEKYNIDKVHIIRLDSVHHTYRSENVQISKNKIRTKNQLFHLILDQKDNTHYSSGLNLLILNKWWKPRNGIDTSSNLNIFIPLGYDEHKYVDLFPNASIHTTKKSYFQFELTK